MNCCINCFYDEEIRTIIRSNKQLGDCNFCEHKNVYIYTVDEQSPLSDIISGIINIYEQCDNGSSLFELIASEWNIFNTSVQSASLLFDVFCKTINANNTINTNIKFCTPSNILKCNGIFSGRSWDDFSSTIKNKNRFHYGFFNANQFSLFLSYSIKKYTQENTFYRARICNNRQGYNADEMGAPPPEKSKSGRVNPEGIVVLYLASDEKTALNEVRASAFDFVSIGIFHPIDNINIVNISGLNKISPVLFSNGLEPLAANIKIFNDIAKELAKPLRRNDSPLEYLPTQYITEFIKSKEYAGVEYASTMGTGGTNIAVFNDSLFKCVSVHNVEIKRIEYTYDNYCFEQ